MAQQMQQSMTKAEGVVAHMGKATCPCVAHMGMVVAPPKASKKVTKKIAASRMREGAGYLVSRAVGQAGTGSKFSEEATDPFILLDELPCLWYGPGEFPGAPPHHRRGLVSVFYLKDGEFHVEYSLDPDSHSVIQQRAGPLTRHDIAKGECAVINAGAGMTLAERCTPFGGKFHAFQCFINLPKKVKQSPASLHRVEENMVSCVGPDSVCAKDIMANVLAGECAGVGQERNPSLPIQIQFLDFTASPGASFEHDIPEGLLTVIVYVYRGSFALGPLKERACTGDTCLLERSGSAVWFQNVGAEDGGLLLLAGQPLEERICRLGTIVCSSNRELHQAVYELKHGRARVEEQAQQTDGFPPRGIS